MPSVWCGADSCRRRTGSGKIPTLIMMTIMARKRPGVAQLLTFVELKR